MKWQTWSNAMQACANDDATMIVSPLGTTSGPPNVAAAIPATKVLLPLPLATDNAAVVRPGSHAPRTNRACQGRTVSASPARRPWETVRVSR